MFANHNIDMGGDSIHWQGRWRWIGNGAEQFHYEAVLEQPDIVHFVKDALKEGQLLIEFTNYVIVFDCAF